MRVRLLALVVLLALAAACGGGGAAKGPTATVGGAATADEAALKKEVEAAYLRSWDVYAKAMRDLDESQLSAAFGEPLLSIRRREFADLRTKSQRAAINVEHRIA